jgi:hypothetical protein
MKELRGNILNEGIIRHFNERIVRWEAYRVSFLSFIINLIFTLTGGSFFLWYQVLKDNRVGIYHTCLLISGIMLGISFLFGIATMLCRLCDFRLTVKKIRLEKLVKSRVAIQSSRHLLKKQKTLTRKIGKLTYYLFYAQVLTFAVGNFLIFLLIMKAYIL